MGYDASRYRSLIESNNTVPFVFDKNESNTVAKTGIENLFPENLFDNFETRISSSTGIKRKEFDQNRKTDFEDYILKRNNIDDFINFDPLIEKMKSI